MIDLDPVLVTDDAVIYKISGDLDVASAPAAAVGMAMVEMQRPRTLILDLSGVDLVDSAGLRVIIDAATRARNAGFDLKVVAHESSRIRQLLHLVGFDLRVPLISEYISAA